MAVEVEIRNKIHSGKPNLGETVVLLSGEGGEMVGQK